MKVAVVEILVEETRNLGGKEDTSCGGRRRFDRRDQENDNSN